MKKILFFVLIVVTLISTVCFATDYESNEGNDIALNEYSSEDDSTFYLDDYDDFYNAYNNVATEEQTREYYREFLVYSREQDALNSLSKTVKAKVIDKKSAKVNYAMNYYTPYKIRYMPITVEVLEGEYEGKIIDMDYVLTADAFDNISLPEVRIGDTIFIQFDTSDEGETAQNAYTAPVDVRISRFSWIVVLTIATAVIVGIILKTKGVKTLLLAFLIFDLIFIVTIPQIVKPNKLIEIEKGDSNFPTTEEIAVDESIAILSTDDNGEPTKVEVPIKNNSIIWLMIIDVIVITAVCLINNLGLGKRTLCAFGITACVLVFAVLLALGMNIITGMNGNAFEAISAAESIINRNIDFGAIYVLTILVIGSVVISNVVSKVLLEHGEESYSENIKSYLASQVSTITVISLVLLTSKVITLIIFKYSSRELMNSEMILNEIVRMLVLIISIVLAVPATEFLKKKLTKNDNQ